MATNGFKTKTVFVTGASGFIGRKVVNKLLDNDCHVLALENNTKITSKHKNLIVIKTDLANLNLGKYKNIDLFVHLAAYMGSLKDKDESRYMKINFEYTKKLFEMCQVNNIKFLYCSSAVVLEKQTRMDWYGKSKLMATEYIKKSKYKNWLIIYPSAVVDVKNIKRGKINGFLMARIGQANRFINIVSVDNIANSIVKIVDKKNLCGEYILGGINMRVNDYLKRSYQIAKKFYIPFRMPQVLVKGLCLIIFGRNNLFNILNKKFFDQKIKSRKAKKDFDYEPEKGVEIFLVK